MARHVFNIGFGGERTEPRKHVTGFGSLGGTFLSDVYGLTEAVEFQSVISQLSEAAKWLRDRAECNGSVEYRDAAERVDIAIDTLRCIAK